jgi:hypothetical protein
VYIPQHIVDFRPISGAPILSRLTEKLLVRNWIRPSFADVDLLDKFAFNFLTGCSQISKIHDKYSSRLNINRSIVHGLGFGTSLYISIKSDLHTLYVNNVIFKFADDTNPEKSYVPIQYEFAHAQEWARSNKIMTNFAKTTETVFHRPHPNRFSVFPSFSQKNSP